MPMELEVNTPTVWHELAAECLETMLDDTDQFARPLNLTVMEKQTIVNAFCENLVDAFNEERDALENYLSRLAAHPPTAKERS